MNCLDCGPSGSFNSGADTPFNLIGTLPTSMVSPSRTWVTVPVRIVGSACAGVARLVAMIIRAICLKKISITIYGLDGFALARCLLALHENLARGNYLDRGDECSENYKK